MSPAGRSPGLRPNGGNYNGIYVLAEKVKRNSSRLDIDRLQPENNNVTNGVTVVTCSRSTASTRTSGPSTSAVRG
jgi:hypothetical protein